LSQRIPGWLKADLPDADSLGRIIPTVSSLHLNTICFEARCPNKQECFGNGSLTFLILGRHCSRRCLFCNVESASPLPVDESEPERIAEACVLLRLRHVVITSVTRDDLADGGAGQFSRCVRLLRAESDGPTVEVLVPDFAGSVESARAVAEAGPDVFAHNLETVPRLYPAVRDRADYGRSLSMLEWVRTGYPDIVMKSGLILGLGETEEEVRSTLRDLSGAGCEIVSIGQYMRPSLEHLAVESYLVPSAFEGLRTYAEELGLVAVSGPRVRSSYQAEAAFHEARRRRRSKCA
jgi:lipoic acid synthetase